MELWGGVLARHGLTSAFSNCNVGTKQTIWYNQKKQNEDCKISQHDKNIVVQIKSKGLASYCCAKTTFTFHFSILTLSNSFLSINNREMKSESDFSSAMASQPSGKKKVSRKWNCGGRFGKTWGDISILCNAGIQPTIWNNRRNLWLLSLSLIFQRFDQ